MALWRVLVLRMRIQPRARILDFQFKNRLCSIKANTRVIRVLVAALLIMYMFSIFKLCDLFYKEPM